MSCTNCARQGPKNASRRRVFSKTAVFTGVFRPQGVLSCGIVAAGNNTVPSCCGLGTSVFFSSSRRRPGSSAFADQGGTRGHSITRRIRGSPFGPSASPMFATASCLRSPAFAGMTNRGFDRRVPGDTGSRAGCVRPRVTRTSSLRSATHTRTRSAIADCSRDASGKSTRPIRPPNGIRRTSSNLQKNGGAPVCGTRRLIDARNRAQDAGGVAPLNFTAVAPVIVPATCAWSLM